MDGSFNYLGKIKNLLSLTDSSEDIYLTVMLDLAKEAVLDYCNLSELPSALNYTLCQIVADSYIESKAKIGGNNSKITGDISSISEDGRTVSFINNSSTALQNIINNKIENRTILNRYKKLYRI